MTSPKQRRTVAPAAPPPTAAAAPATPASGRTTAAASRPAANPPSLWPLIYVVGALVAACIAGIIATASHALTPRTAVLAVERLEVDADNMLAPLIAEARTPVVLDGSPADRWAARGWTPEKLVARAAPGVFLNQTQSHSDRTFLYFNPEKPLVESRVYAWERPVARVLDLPIGEFFERVERDRGAWYYYWSSQIEHLGADLARDVEPSHAFAVSDEDLSVNVWFGSAGVSSSLHYDTFENFFVQLRGSKKFTLLAPTEWPSLYLYPRLHPSFRQSRIDLDAPDHDRFRLFQYAQRYEVTLGPGDVLYVPPFWFHRVEALDDSISVNIWSQSRETAAIEEIHAAAIPFEDSWTPQQMQLATQAYVAHLLDDLYEKRVASLFVANLVDNRWATLVADATRTVDAASDPVCEQAHAALDWHPRKADLQRGLDTLVPLFRSLPLGVREMALADYIEELVYMIVGDADRVHPFLTNCFHERILGAVYAAPV